MQKDLGYKSLKYIFFHKNIWSWKSLVNRLIRLNVKLGAKIFKCVSEILGSIEIHMIYNLKFVKHKNLNKIKLTKFETTYKKYVTIKHTSHHSIHFLDSV